MKLKVGDKVKFLNESGGGIVTKVVSPKMVHVAIEDGFELPTLVSNLIKIGGTSGPESFFEEDFKIPVQPAKNVVEEPVTEERSFEIQYNKSAKPFAEGLYLALVPQEQKWLITGDLDLYIINHTGYDILFSFYLNLTNDNFQGKDYDAIPARSKILIATIRREKIEKWEKGTIQFLFFTDKTSKLRKPVHTTFQIKTSGLHRETTYHTNSFLEEKAYLVNLHQISDTDFIDDGDTVGKYGPQIEIHKAQDAVPTALIDRHKTSPREAEVDLHISKLRDDFSTLPKHEIFKIQVHYFEKSLNSAIKNHFKKVTFIHGIGNGTLKKAIQDILSDYEGLDFRDSPFEIYGPGAIDVIINENL